jgi:polyhydroxyalkanoate synthase subunit PhaC
MLVDNGASGCDDAPMPVQGEESPADAAGALDLVLIDAALGSARRFRPGVETWRVARRLSTRPWKLALRGTDLLREYARIAIGTSTLAPERRDRRFADPAWTDNPVIHRLLQAYLATGQTAEALVADAHLDWRDDERARFLVNNFIDAAAPSNNPFISPVAWKAVIDTGGANVVRGAGNMLRDMASAPRVPTMVEPSAFDVGTTLATRPGWVVMRTPMFEVVQYTPQTERVRTVPLLIVPPVINKYYIVDIAPGRSLIEYLVGCGQQVFVISWRNPDARHRQWGLDAYGQAILDALDGVLQIGDVERAHLLALCSGGIIASMVAAYLVETAQLDRMATLNLGVTVLDQARAGTPSALLDERTAKLAIAASARRGYLDGRHLAEVFAWLRPNDLIWNYWVNNYLQGQQPPPFDVLYWNADTTRMTARLHRDFIELALRNALTKPGEATMLGQSVDLSKVDVDSYVIAGIADHLCPWESCYATTQLLGGMTRFVLSTSGHIASLVNPPTNQKATFQTNEDNVPDARAWLRAASSEKGSWWPDYARWLGERSGGDKDAREEAGGRNFPPLEPAPGTYVFDR